MGRIEELAQILLRDGYADNEADARRAALDVLLAALDRSDPAPSQRSGLGEDHTGGTCDRILAASTQSSVCIQPGKSAGPNVTSRRDACGRAIPVSQRSIRWSTRASCQRHVARMRTTCSWKRS